MTNAFMTGLSDAASGEMPSLFLGQAHFIDPELEQICRTRGQEAAWSVAYALMGTKAPQAARGSFAIAFSPQPGRVLLAVDRFARQSLCYRREGDTLRFAARADELADNSKDLDPQALFDYLYFHTIPSPRTIYRGVFRLPPGHFALWQDGRLTVAPYWQPQFTEDNRASFDSLRSEFRDLLEQAVREQLDGRQTGCFLSGGTDSSTVSGMIGKATGEPAATYSIGFEAEGYDEMEYARIAARHFNTRHHEYYITPEDLIRSIPDVARHYDQPFGNSSALPAFYCAKMAHGDGVQKMLAGDGGDELFGGNTRYAKQRVFHYYWALPETLRKHVVEPMARPMRHFPIVRKVASYVQQASVPMPDRTQTYNLLMGLGLSNVLTPTFLASVAADAPLQQQRQVWQQCHSHSLVNRMLAFDWRYTLGETDLPKVCGTTALAGVDVGFPMLDERLVDFSLRLPAEYKVKGLKLRWFFKEALRGFLPDDIITKKKQGFGLPFGVWVNRHEGLKRLAATSLESLADRRIVRPEFIRALLAEHLPTHPGYYGEMIWILLMLEQWLQGHAPAYQTD